VPRRETSYLSELCDAARLLPAASSALSKMLTRCFEIAVHVREATHSQLVARINDRSRDTRRAPSCFAARQSSARGRCHIDFPVDMAPVIALKPPKRRPAFGSGRLQAFSPPSPYAALESAVFPRRKFTSPILASIGSRCTCRRRL
jgi:hypothetical protein